MTLSERWHQFMNWMDTTDLPLWKWILLFAFAFFVMDLVSFVIANRKNQ